MSGHTPGPWSWWDSCSFRRLSAKNDGDVMHAVIQRGDGHPDVHFPNGGYKGPDARLIAAAPMLLAAAECEEALSMRVDEGHAVLERHGWIVADRFDLPATEFVAHLRRAAIAAATGDSHE